MGVGAELLLFGRERASIQKKVFGAVEANAEGLDLQAVGDLDGQLDIRQDIDLHPILRRARFVLFELEESPALILDALFLFFELRGGFF